MNVSFFFFLDCSKIPAFLHVVDIAGLVKGAHAGQGLGNAFLSHISACDGIFHMTRESQVQSRFPSWELTSSTGNIKRKLTTTYIFQNYHTGESTPKPVSAKTDTTFTQIVTYMKGGLFCQLNCLPSVHSALVSNTTSHFIDNILVMLKYSTTSFS